jgi:hypothetical protein
VLRAAIMPATRQVIGLNHALEFMRVLRYRFQL